MYSLNGSRHRFHLTEQARNLIQTVFVTRPLCPVLILRFLINLVKS